MEPLAKPLRRQLEDAIVKARDLAEQAAQAALQHLGVGDADAPPHLTDSERALRRRLRAHGRQLGDQRAPNGAQAIEQLAQETAYEHWHRMLFARFLAENQLLMHPEGVPLSLAECQELAQDEGAANGWELAGRYAARMLPQIFRPDSPVLALDLAPEHQRALERLLTNLAPETFHASDGLGWVYQFWQTKQKDRVNASEVKIGARELPAVTQLFTEPYMVAFLLDNSLGAWWAARRLSDEDLRTATSEEALRHKAAIPGLPLTYLRFVQDEQGVWTPAAGTFDAWPTPLSELKVMDPCCGSGHFLVAVLQMLVRMRMALEGLDARAAIDAVLRENLHGLELDQRCVEIAAFALALTAWRWPDAGGYRPLPALNLACSGLGIHASKADWLQLAEGDVDLQHALERIYELFQDAPTLGSLIDPRRAFRDDDLIDLGPQRGWERVAPLVERALASEDDQQRELGVVAAGLARAVPLLADLVNYHQLDRAKLERLIYTYLDDWIRLQQRAGANGGADAGTGTGADTGTDHGANAHGGADERLAAARALKTKLEAILDGEAPLDIFVRWKPLAERPIGWNPDLNDGVRLNIRPFLLAGDVGKKGAGVLRAKPNIKWTKDRGKDVESAPWFPVFNGERINDHHLTLAEKRAARELAQRG